MPGALPIPPLPDLPAGIALIRTAQSPAEGLLAACKLHGEIVAYRAAVLSAAETALADLHRVRCNMDIAVDGLEAEIRRLRADLILSAYPPMQNPPNG